MYLYTTSLQDVFEEHLLLGQVHGREVRVPPRHAAQGPGADFSNLRFGQKKIKKSGNICTHDLCTKCHKTTYLQ
jgi:hypothetical protein